jgi:hypothetical protein
MTRCFPTSLFLFSGEPARGQTAPRSSSPNRGNILIRLSVRVDIYASIHRDVSLPARGITGARARRMLPSAERLLGRDMKSTCL